MHSSLASRGVILAVAFLLLISPAPAQINANVSGNTNTGFPANGAFSGSDFDNVQTNNGNLHIEIPIKTLNGRGEPITYKYVYNSKGWGIKLLPTIPPFKQHGTIWPELSNTM